MSKSAVTFTTHTSHNHNRRTINREYKVNSVIEAYEQCERNNS